MKILYTIILVLVLCLNNVYAADIVLWRNYKDYIVLDRYTLQKIFTQKITKWPDGKPIQVFIKPMFSVEHRDFVLNVLGMSLFSYQQLLGDDIDIIEVNSDKQMIQKIEKTPGSIGYINYKIIVCSKDVIIIDSNEVK